MPSTMTLSYLVFPSGTPVPETQVPQILVPDDSPKPWVLGNSSTWSPRPGIRSPPTPSPSGLCPARSSQPSSRTAFLIQQQVITFPAPSDESFNATAWYVLDGGSGAPVALVWAFSLNKNTPIPTATLTSTPPFASVSPSGCVEGPNAVSTTDPAAIAAGNVTITAANLIGGSGRFQQWLQFFGNGDVTGQQLTVKAGDPGDAGSSDAIAVYSIPQPDPCQPIRTTIADLNPPTSPTLQTTSASAVRLRLTSANASRKTASNTFIPAVTRGMSCSSPVSRSEGNEHR